MNNDNKNEGDLILAELASVGFHAAFLPYSYMEQIDKIYETHNDNSENTPYDIKKRFRSNQPPDIPFKPLSFLVISFQSLEGEICLNHKGEIISIPVPPIYLDGSIRKQISNILKPFTESYQLAEVWSVSLKLLAVLSGLGEYGRNTLCYVDGQGSFCNFVAYYTDIPCAHGNHSLAFMERCNACNLCVENCPTEAIGRQLVIDTSRCLTMLNEFEGQMPDWLAPNVHHAIVGCMRCQEICPMNQSVSRQKKDALILNDTETELLLSSSADNLSPELVRKLSDYGLLNNFISLAGRNAKLAIEAR